MKPWRHNPGRLWLPGSHGGRDTVIAICARWCCCSACCHVLYAPTVSQRAHHSLSKHRAIQLGCGVSQTQHACTQSNPGSRAQPFTHHPTCHDSSPEDDIQHHCIATTAHWRLAIGHQKHSTREPGKKRVLPHHTGCAQSMDYAIRSWFCSEQRNRGWQQQWYGWTGIASDCTAWLHIKVSIA